MHLRAGRLRIIGSSWRSSVPSKMNVDVVSVTCVQM